MILIPGMLPAAGIPSLRKWHLNLMLNHILFPFLAFILYSADDLKTENLFTLSAYSKGMVLSTGF